MSKSESLLVEERPIDQVRPYERNPRVIPQSAIDKVANSIKSFGWRQPIVVDPDGVILVGHTRRLAALQLGLSTIPVHVAHGLTRAQARAYRLADNRTAQEASWDEGDLSAELEALAAEGFDLLMAGFDPVELPDFEAAFEPLEEGEVGRLDERSDVACPACGHRFKPQ